MNTLHFAMLPADSWLFTLHAVDNIVFMLYLVAVGYLSLFAVTSTLRRNRVYPKARKEYSFAVIFYALDDSDLIIEGIESFLAQDYSQQKYSVVVVSTPRNQHLNARILAMKNVGLIATPNDEYNKTRSIKYAVSILDGYDYAVIMDFNDTVDPDFLTEINKVCYAGSPAIQAHRVARTIESDTEVFSAVSEEINNSIFRRGHVNLGLSSALSDSGMVVKFPWLKKNIAQLPDFDIVKELEKMLLEQRVYINYTNDIFVYDRKARKPEEYNAMRRAWIAESTRSFGQMLTALPKALFSGNYDYFDKLFQWLIPSRTILIGTLVMITVLLIILSWGMAIKWVAIMFVLIVAFTIAMPDNLIDARFIKAMRTAPMLFVVTAFNMVRRKVKLSK